jgi:predicted SAM-dependent methyltransferase
MLNGWINIDYKHMPGAHGDTYLCHNLLEKFPFESNSVSFIFTKRDTRQIPRECRRVLKPGGLIRISVPDLNLEMKNNPNLAANH